VNVEIGACARRRFNSGFPAPVAAASQLCGALLRGHFIVDFS
jgi:hypothetical protein